MTAVDLCAGDGWFTMPMARLARRVAAIDIDPALLTLARRPLAGLSNCQFVEADAYDLAKVVSEPVDFVFLANVFQGVPERTRLSRIVAKSWRPAGSSPSSTGTSGRAKRRLCLARPAVPRRTENAPKAVKEAVEPAGLRFVHFVEASPCHYSAVFKKPGDATG